MIDGEQSAEVRDDRQGVASYKTFILNKNEL